MSAKHNFNAGPSILPAKVLERAEAMLRDTEGSGMSVMEWSHRGSDYDRVHHRTEQRLRHLLGVFDDHEVLFLHGGASLQFATVPWNLATPERPGGYVNTGVWSEKALEAANVLGRGRELWSGKECGFTKIPSPSAYEISKDLAYVHITTNNTIFGTEYRDVPETGVVPLVADMSSNILSQPFPSAELGMIYAGAQKNLGPAGMAVVIIRKDLVRPIAGIPSILTYAAHVKAKGLYHTPPTFAVWLMGEVLGWVEEQGGPLGMGRLNGEKAKHLYDAIDRTGFFRGTADVTSRSRMNVTFRIHNEALEPVFLEEATRAGFVGLKGHRSVGGLRASLYNALPLTSVVALVDFMEDFERRNG